MPMLEGVEDLALAQLNEATQAFVELEYNRKVHSVTGEAPIDRFLQGPDVRPTSTPPSSIRSSSSMKLRR
jgi:putative transposase